MSPLDAGALNTLATELAINHPFTRSVSMIELALVCAECHVILERRPVVAGAKPEQKLAPEHPARDGRPCDGAGHPAQWHPIAED